MVEQFSFYVRFPGKAPISALCLDHYVTDQRPIICLGSQDGDIAIYYLDKLNPETGKVGPELIEKFNFFERGVDKDAHGSDSEDDRDGLDSLLDSRSSVKPFVKKVGSTPSETQKHRLHKQTILDGGSEEEDHSSNLSYGDSKPVLD